jgi:cyanophycinase-like exopeptidase
MAAKDVVLEVAQKASGYCRARRPANILGRPKPERRTGMTNRMSFKWWQVTVVGAVAGALVFGSPMIPVATAAPASVVTPSATAVGNTYGGVTSQGFPVIVDMNATRRQVVRVVAAIDASCTSDAGLTIPDRFTKVAVTRSGKFRVVYGPYVVRNDDGTTTDWQGRMTGLLNDAKTKIAGTWRLIAVYHAAAGAVTDTCDSGLLTWRAKQ